MTDGKEKNYLTNGQGDYYKNKISKLFVKLTALCEI
jgi:hypothetical protein